MPPLPNPRPLRVLREDLTAAGNQAVASGLVSAQEATPALAAAAVQLALKRAGSDCANSILLFLTPDFARNAQAAVTAASRAGHCVQVAGACVPGVFTESDWLIDRPAAAALVLCGNFGLGPAQQGETAISLARPEAVIPAWLASPVKRCGGLSTDSGAQRPGRVWLNGKISTEGEISLGLSGARSRSAISRGIRIFSPPLAAEAEGYELRRLGGCAALDTLLSDLPLETRDLAKLPLHLLYAGVLDADSAANTDAAIAGGRYSLVPLLSGNAEFGSVTLAMQLPTGARVFWALRQPLAAEQDMAAMLAALAPSGSPDPAFALMFSCMGRGPYFYGGADRDLELLCQRFPGVPLLGAYCAGEIGSLPSGNALIHNSVVLTLYDTTADVQSDA